MIPEILATSGAILVLLILSGFFSGSETALTAASRARMHKLERDGNRNARIVNRLIAEKEQLIGSILIGNNLVNILASAIATSLFLTLFGPAGVAYATLAMTALVVVFAEVLPKTYAIGNPNSMALRVAPTLRIIVQTAAPLARAVQWTVAHLLALASAGRGDAALSAHDELRGAIDLHHEEGAVVKDDRDMLGGILDLRELEVSELMVHRTKMETVDADDPPEVIVDEVVKSSFTRLPLWRDEPDNIIGVLHAKDLLWALLKSDGDLAAIDFISLCAEPWFVPDTTRVQDQLNAFLKRKAHFALVVDEYGEVMGLITLEDILEEIVGEIADEHDVVVRGVRPQPDGTVNADGATTIRDLNRMMDWQLPDEEATTIAGLVIHEAQTIPEPGQAFTFHGFRFEILRKQRNKIVALRITPLDTQRRQPSAAREGRPTPPKVPGP